MREFRCRRTLWAYADTTAADDARVGGDSRTWERILTAAEQVE